MGTAIAVILTLIRFCRILFQHIKYRYYSRKVSKNVCHLWLSAV